LALVDELTGYCVDCADDVFGRGREDDLAPGLEGVDEWFRVVLDGVAGELVVRKGQSRQERTFSSSVKVTFQSSLNCDTDSGSMLWEPPT
jgi:hypothetical protein